MATLEELTRIDLQLLLHAIGGTNRQIAIANAARDRILLGLPLADVVTYAEARQADLRQTDVELPDGSKEILGLSALAYANQLVERAKIREEQRDQYR